MYCKLEIFASLLFCELSISKVLVSSGNQKVVLMHSKTLCKYFISENFDFMSEFV